MTVRVGSLFSGIGGLERGLELATGGQTVWQVEQDPFCQRVLARHWPEAKRYDDVQAVGAAQLASVDIICGGFPCQDISVIGRGAGLDGARSGLWREYARIVGELGPAFVFIENVAALVSRGLERVLKDLAVLGYDAAWGVFSAAAAGAPHLRRRLFILAAHPDRIHLRQQPGGQRGEGGTGALLARGAGKRGGAWAGWTPSSPVRRVDDGIPGGMDGRRWRRPAADRHRLKALGNAVVQQVSARAWTTLLPEVLG